MTACGCRCRLPRPRAPAPARLLSRYFGSAPRGIPARTRTGTASRAARAPSIPARASAQGREGGVEVAVAGAAETVDHETGGVDAILPAEEERPGEEAGLRVQCRRVQQGRKPPWPYLDVVVDERGEIGARSDRPAKGDV